MQHIVFSQMITCHLSFQRIIQEIILIVIRLRRFSRRQKYLIYLPTFIFKHLGLNILDILDNSLHALILMCQGFQHAKEKLVGPK